MTWDTLKTIADNNRKFKEDEETEKKVACPNCGHAPLDERNGILNCPIGDYRSTNNAN